MGSWRRSLILAPLTALIVAAPLSVAANYGFGTDIRVNDDLPGTSYRSTLSGGMHSIAARGDTIYLVWQDSRDGFAGVYFARSEDGGKSFGPNAMVADVPMGAVPSLALAHDGALYVAWDDRRHDRMHDIYFDKSRDGGVTWGPDIRVDNTHPPGNVQRDPCIAVDDLTGNVYVAWHGPDSLGHWPVFFARSTDGGDTFETTHIADTGANMVAEYPTMAVGPDGRIYIAYMEHNVEWYDIEVIVSEDEGISFLPRAWAGYGVYPSISVSPSGDVYVAFLAGTWPFQYDHLEVSRSQDGGVTFQPPVVVEEGTGGTPSLAAGPNGLVCVAFNDWAAPGLVRFSYSPDAGSTFSPSVCVQDPGASATLPTLAVDGAGRAFVAWTDYRHGEYADVYFDVGLRTTDVTASSSVAYLAALSGGLTASPNPFARGTTLRCLLPAGAPGKEIIVSVFSVQGRCVRELQPESSDAVAEAEWDGTDDSGRPLPSGIYFARLRVGDRELTERLVLVR